MRLWRSRRQKLERARRTLPFEEARWKLARPIAVLKVDELTGRHTLLGYAENLSSGGMMIGTVWPKEVGSSFRVEFALPAPADVVVRCRCKVAWARPYSEDPVRSGMGLEFRGLREAAAESIESLWRDGHPPEGPASQTWSDYDEAWIPWAPQLIDQPRR